MPIYEYECENQHRFEKWQSMKDDPLTECPTCGSAVHKIFHPAGIIFKGSGWYITDSRKPPAESKAESKSDSKADKTETPDQAKSEAKTETKSESKSQDTLPNSNRKTPSVSSE